MDVAPTPADFTVIQSINTGEGSNVTVTDVTLDSTGEIVTLTVEPVVATTADQDVVYSVSYKGGEAKEATFTVAADAEAQLAEAVAAAKMSVEALEAAIVDLASQEKIGAANALVEPAQTAIEALPEGNENIATLTTRVDNSLAAIAAAYVIVTATDAVVVAEGSLLEADVLAAQELVTALPTSDLKTLSNARLDVVRAQITTIIQKVNTAINDIQLYAALNVKPFVNVNQENITRYNILLGADSLKATLALIQAEVNTVNAAVIAEELAGLVGIAADAVEAVEVEFVTVNAEEQATFNGLVAVAQEAINALPADSTDEEAATPKADLQARLVAQVQFNAEYVTLVKPVLTAELSETNKQFKVYNALVATGFANVNSDNVIDYIEAIDGEETTVVEIQNAIDISNATVAVEALTIEGALAADQAEIDAAQALVTALVEAEVVIPDTLQTAIDTAQVLLNDANEASVALAEAVSAAEQAKVDFLAAGGDVEATVYVDLQAALDAETQVTATIEEKTADLEEATLALTNLAEAVSAAEQAKLDFLAAGGDVEATVYVDLQAALDAETQVTATIEEKTADLEVATLALTDLAEAVSAAEQAKVDFLAAGGEEAASVYVDLQAALDAETQVTATIDEKTADLEEVTKDIIDTGAINAAISTTELQPLLVALGLSEYNNMTSVQRLEVTILFLSATAEVDFADIAEVSGALLEVIGEVDSDAGTVGDQPSGYFALLAGVNNATTITATDSALEALDNEQYDALTPTQQLDAAEKVLNNKPENGYTSITQMANQF